MPRSGTQPQRDRRALAPMSVRVAFATREPISIGTNPAVRHTLLRTSGQAFYSRPAITLTARQGEPGAPSRSPVLDRVPVVDVVRAFPVFVWIAIPRVLPRCGPPRVP
jgi:hypothetical protein